MRIRTGYVVSFIVAALFVSMMVYYDRLDSEEYRNRNRDPRQGLVLMRENGSLAKVCDGSTLLYGTSYPRGTVLETVNSSIPNSTECVK